VERRAATSLLPKPQNVASLGERIAQRLGELKRRIGRFQDEQYLMPRIKRQSEARRIFREME
jgi:hypothetical protein